MTYPVDKLGRQPILNDAGLGAMRYLRLIPTIVHCGPSKGGRDYAFAVQANINLSWVNPDDFGCCLAVKGGCCGVKKSGVIIYANEDDVRRWSNKGGR